MPVVDMIHQITFHGPAGCENKGEENDNLKKVGQDLA
jgi:hypothetical protein